MGTEKVATQNEKNKEYLESIAGEALAKIPREQWRDFLHVVDDVIVKQHWKDFAHTVDVLIASARAEFEMKKKAGER